MKYIVKILTKNESHSVVFDREKLLVMWVGQGLARSEKKGVDFCFVALSIIGASADKNYAFN